ncbi:MAG: transporter [Terriglobales bacterium]
MARWSDRCARRLAPLLLTLLLAGAGRSSAQDLTPRAYIITPIHSNAIVVAYGYYNGSLLFNGTIPVTGAVARLNVPIFSVYHSFDFLGRTASLAVALPYAFGSFRGTVAGAEASARRSGLLAVTFRVAVNLMGGPAMEAAEFARWRQKTIVGASFELVPPSGQYDPVRLINFGSNRWAFHGELGYSRRWGNWILDAYGGGWFFTTNPNFFSSLSPPAGGNTQSENPVGAFQGHASYNFKPRLWFSLDGNFWVGGATGINGVENPLTLQRNSRVGMTFSLPISRHQSVKASLSTGAYIRYGGSYKNASLGWQYSWLGRPN